MEFATETSLSHLRAVAQLQFDQLVTLRATQAAEAAEREALAAEVQVMAAEKATLVAEREALTVEMETLATENAALKARLAEMEARLGQQAKALYGKKSERKPRPLPPPKPPKQPQIGHGPREQGELEVVEITHELPPEARLCPCCGGALRPLGEEAEASELISATARAFVREVHRRLKYRCSCNGVVVTAPGPQRLLPGGRYSPAFAIEVAIGKYYDHLPLERQAHIMKRDGLKTDSQTLWDQLDALAAHLAPTYEAILASILTQPVIHADETRWPLLANGKTKENKLFQAWGLVAPDLVGYRILDSRGKAAAATVLGNFKGVLMADGYTVYQSLAKDGVPSGRARWSTACWPGPQGLAVLPQSGIGKAVAYMLRLEPGLRRYLDDAHVPIDNNRCERALRGVVLGRKNHIGSRSRRGTEVAAIMYTLMESARLAGVSPRGYTQAAVELALRSPGAVLLPADYAAVIATAPP
ncbi:MAG: transposase [Candidatus Sericytochromatia bacterium]|nr:transposase [Candidatus Sericytochromatia bacterium]